ncbi:P-loop containing nucleoside triphosphate hydrolase protein [Trametes maxima]|nr:P-loop containing nucleoside triphosphate hydrolase protein [Trametes maxima]
MACFSRKRAHNLYFSQRDAQRQQNRPRLTAEEVKLLAQKMREAFGWDADPKDFQLEAVQAQLEGVDMIVQAPTGAGKTALAAGPHVWSGSEGKFTIMVCPLLSLEEEMVQSFDTDYGLKAVALNSANGACSPLVIRDILSMKYQIILVSPEMLQSRAFVDRILRNTAFMRNMISMFVDEAHCIAHWGADFRKKYGSLGKIRAFLPRGTPVIAMTATLTAKVQRTIHRVLLFGQSVAPSRFINKGNDRPNVSIVVRACEHPLNSYHDLDFVIPPSFACLEDVPKTYIYVDNISLGGEIIDYLNAKIAACFRPPLTPDSNRWTLRAKPPPQGIVRPFNATLSQEYRGLAMAHFRRGSIRILVCTDAAGMGCNIPDIDRVVQWKLPATFSNFIQRAGRAARGRNREGLAVLLVEKSAYNVDLVRSGPNTNTDPSSDHPALLSLAAKEGVSKRTQKEVREYAKSHGVERGGSKKHDAHPNGPQPQLDPESAPDEGLLVFVQSTTCRRRIWAQAFDSSLATEPTVQCCDLCHPQLLDKTHPATVQRQRQNKASKRGEPNALAERKLREWRAHVYARNHPYAQYDETAILDDDLINLLSSYGPLSAPQLAERIKDKWAFWEQHNEELTTFIASLDLTFIPLTATRPRVSLHEPTAAPSSTDFSTPMPGGGMQDT